MTNLLRPLVKWVGGKRQLLPEITRLLPPTSLKGTYFEPFLGGGAVLFSLEPARAKVNDINVELINLYKVVRAQPSELIELVTSYPHDKDFYYSLRGIDRDADAWRSLTSLEQAARTLYLNRAGFNGLYRVNSKGQHNVPFGSNRHLNFNAQNIRSVSDYLRNNNVVFTSADYREALSTARPGDFVYIDPPYDPITSTSSFTAYASGGFTRQNQVELRKEVDRLTREGVHVMLSNSATDFIKAEYAHYRIHIVKARRQVNSKPTVRGQVDEIIVTNYGETGKLDREGIA